MNIPTTPFLQVPDPFFHIIIIFWGEKEGKTEELLLLCFYTFLTGYCVLGGLKLLSLPLDIVPSGLIYYEYFTTREKKEYSSLPYPIFITTFLWNRILKRAIQIYIFPKDQENRPYLVMRVNHFLVLSVSWDGPVWNSSATQIQNYFTLNPWYTTVGCKVFYIEV